MIIELYEKGHSVQTIMFMTGKTQQSVIATLSAAGVYRPQLNEPVKTKLVLIKELEELLGCPKGYLKSLEKASKPALSFLLDKYRN